MKSESPASGVTSKPVNGPAPCTTSFEGAQQEAVDLLEAEAFRRALAGPESILQSDPGSGRSFEESEHGPYPHGLPVRVASARTIATGHVEDPST